ncbi:MAG: hypothetical protein CMI27_01730 [Opitutae bacterium]|nr:hypothetical protein [Opitutae bacterium]
MIHKIFHWWYLKSRSSYGKTYKKIDSRSKDRDLINYFHDFGDDGMNVRSSHWLYKKFIRLFLWILFLVFASFFAFESYHGLIIYDN